MSNQEDDFGIIKGIIDEPYANFCSSLTRDKFNMVGIYYRKSKQTSIYLFRSFDGTSINYFSHGISLEMLSSHHLITRLILYPFDVQTWEIAQLNQSPPDKSLFDRFLMAFSRSLMSSNYHQNYSIILNRYFNSEIKEPIPNGYYRVNDIILITCGLDTLNRWGSIDRDIIDCKYLQSEKELNCSSLIKYHDPLPDKVKTDSVEKLTLLSQEFISLLVDESTTFKVTSREPSYESVSESKVEDKEILLHLRQSLDDVFNPRKNIYPIDLFEIQNMFNLLATKHSIQPLNFSLENLTDKSIILSYPKELSLESSTTASPICVPLKCGNTIILSTSGCNLNRFSPNELVEILRYCLSVRNAHTSKRYVNIIIDTIVTELAQRNR